MIYLLLDLLERRIVWRNHSRLNRLSWSRPKIITLVVRHCGISKSIMIRLLFWRGGCLFCRFMSRRTISRRLWMRRDISFIKRWEIRSRGRGRWSRDIWIKSEDRYTKIMSRLNLIDRPIEIIWKELTNSCIILRPMTIRISSRNSFRGWLVRSWRGRRMGIGKEIGIWMLSSMRRIIVRRWNLLWKVRGKIFRGMMKNRVSIYLESRKKG